MIDGQILDALLEAGASAEMIVAAVKAAQAREEARRDERRDRDAERQRRVRARRTQSAAVTPRPSDASVTPADRADPPPNDNISNPPRPRSSQEDLPPNLAERLVMRWNETAAKAGAAPCPGLSARRMAALRARRGEHGEAALFEAVRNLATSRFHCGENQRGWRASLGWLLGNAEAFQRVLELIPAGTDAAQPMTLEERLASAERTAAMLERIGRSEEAAEMRRTAEGLRRDMNQQGDRHGTGTTGPSAQGGRAQRTGAADHPARSRQ